MNVQRKYARQIWGEAHDPLRTRCSELHQEVSCPYERTYMGGLNSKL